MAPAESKRSRARANQRGSYDEHFPMLIYDGETFGDFNLTTRFKIVGGVMEQMAGIVFHFQNDSNFYVFRVERAGPRRCAFTRW